ncbi:phosphatidylserine decarboxylase [Deinococcus reticulitermitis]|uniref:Phosphatidylserine decarboxylase n=1 Tax=Deinococcus reticulitermitis TaxID=856736 RepID=A0A1H6VCS0_9DEIO|nr:phosphatidylserine decarboxylase [Deinococcus reticulitermitis]SEJ00784.1 phosphatidylserine decarboxylase [Deinococcus reticulitermitis]
MRLSRRLPLLAALAAGAWYLRGVYRFRDPVRLPPQEPGSVLSPADGLAAFVKRTQNGAVDGVAMTELLGPGEHAAGWLLGVFVGPLDVHYIYAPLGGRVAAAARQEGGRSPVPLGAAAQLLAGRPVNLLGTPAAQGNERFTLTVQAEGGPSVTVALVAPGAGLNATTYLEAGQTVRQGNKAAFLAEGGLVLVALPETLIPQVSVGERVTGAQTVLARSPEFSPPGA